MARGTLAFFLDGIWRSAGLQAMGGPGVGIVVILRVHAGPDRDVVGQSGRAHGQALRWWPLLWSRRADLYDLFPLFFYLVGLFFFSFDRNLLYILLINKLYSSTFLTGVCFYIIKCKQRGSTYAVLDSGIVIVI